MKDLKTKIFDIIAAARTGDKTVNNATNEIISLIELSKKKNKIIRIGFMGDNSCYLNIDKEEAVERYMKTGLMRNEYKSIEDFMEGKGLVSLEEINFEDEFYAYWIA